MHPLIASAQNPKIKRLIALAHARGRKTEGLFCIEGEKELSLAMAAGYAIGQVFFCPDIVSSNRLLSMGVAPHTLIPIVASVFEKVAYRKTTGGIISVATPLQTRLEDLALSSAPLILVLQSIEKPGNLGALLRTADAAGLDAVILCDTATDIYNPNVIRSSVGCVFTNHIVSVDSATTLRWLNQQGIETYGASLQGSEVYSAANYTRPCAIMMGAEHDGLSGTLQQQAKRNILIPMHGKIDSMNVSVAAGIILFEALRQRQEAR